LKFRAATQGELAAQNFAVLFKDNVLGKVIPMSEQLIAVTNDEVERLIGSALCKPCFRVKIKLF